MKILQTEASKIYTFWNFLIFIFIFTLYRVFILLNFEYDFYFDEAYYWEWAQSFEFGYFSKPPMIAWVIMLSTSICGDSEFCIKIGSLILYVFTTLVIYLISNELYGKKVAFYSGIAFFTLPALFLSTMVISTDAPFLFFWSLSLFLFIRSIKSDTLSYWLITGLSAGLGMLSKYTMVVFLVSAICYLFYEQKYRHYLKSKKLYLSIGVAFLVFLPNLVWNINNHFVSFLHTKSNADLQGLQAHPIRVIEFLGAQFGVFGPILFGILFYLLVSYKRFCTDTNFKLLWWFIVPFLMLILTIAFLSRAHANWAAPIYIAATILTVAYLVGSKKTALLNAAIVINILLGCVVYHFDSIAKTLNIELTSKNDPFKKMRKWDELGKRVSVILSKHPKALLLADDRMALSELIYYVKPHPFDAVIWNPSGKIDNHFALTTNLQRHIGKDFVFVVAPKNIASIKKHFSNTKKIETIFIKIHKDYALRYDVYLLENFMGYR